MSFRACERFRISDDVIAMAVSKRVFSSIIFRWDIVVTGKPPGEGQ